MSDRITERLRRGKDAKNRAAQRPSSCTVPSESASKMPTMLPKCSWPFAIECKSGRKNHLKDVDDSRQSFARRAPPLKLRLTSTAADVKRAYRKALRAVHPDKLAQASLTDRLVAEHVFSASRGTCSSGKGQRGKILWQLHPNCGSPCVGWEMEVMMHLLVVSWELSA